MTLIVSASPGLLSRIGVSRTTQAAPPNAVTFRIRQSAADDLRTRVTLGHSADSGAVYCDPRATSGVVHVWSSPVGEDDTVSALMAP